MRIFTIILTILAIMVGCGRSEESGRPVVVVSTPAVGRIVDEIGGEEVETIVLLPPGSDPESYEPDMASMKRSAKADAFLTLNTIGFEQRLTEQMASGLPDLQSIDLSGGIEMLTDSHGHGKSDAHSHSGEHSRGHSEAEGDPHLLSSPANARIIARNTVETLSRLYPAYAEEFRRRGGRLDSLLAVQQEEVGALLKGIEGGAFIVMHPSLSYFGRDYGLRQISLEREGKETTPRQMEVRLEEARKGNPRLMVSDGSHNPEQAAEIARRLNLPIISTDFNAADFIEQYTRLAKALAKPNRP